MSPELKSFLDDVRRAMDERLVARFPVSGHDPGRLAEALRYAVDGGKRLRPAVCLAAAKAAGGTWEGALPAACAVELVHAYTLVHDDLPCMDDDGERRGKPTVHVAFGEATAVLVGDGLLTEAFACLAELGPSCAEAAGVLARRAGFAELLKGQARDLAGDAVEATVESIERLHAEKTGALFAAAAELGAIAAGADATARDRLARYGMAVGIAFQHADDLLDDDHPALADDARRRARELVKEAHGHVASFGDRARLLVALADLVADRAR